MQNPIDKLSTCQAVGFAKEWRCVPYWLIFRRLDSIGVSGLTSYLQKPLECSLSVTWQWQPCIPPSLRKRPALPDAGCYDSECATKARARESEKERTLNLKPQKGNLTDFVPKAKIVLTCSAFSFGTLHKAIKRPLKERGAGPKQVFRVWGFRVVWV